MGQWTREQIIEAAKQTAAQSSEPLSKPAFFQRSGLTEYQLRRFIPEGGWSEVAKSGRLRPDRLLGA
jgi:hypothetical protein